MTVLSDADLRIRPLAFDEADHLAIERWMHEPEVVRTYVGWDDHIDLAVVRERFSRERFTVEALTGWIIECLDAPIGFIQTYRLSDDRTDPRVHHSAIEPEMTWALDLFIGEPDFRERGYGVRSLRLICTHLLDKGAQAVSVDPFVTNKRAIAAYERAGFVTVAELPHNEVFDGEWQDALLMVVDAAGLEQAAGR